MSGAGDRMDVGSNGIRAAGDAVDARAGLDSDLRDSFAALRRQEQATAPSFETMSGPVARHRRPAGYRRRLRPLAVAAAGAAVAGAALVVAFSVWLRTHAPQPGSSAEVESSITTWHPATDFLLRTPGQEVLAAPTPFGSSSIGIELGIGGTPAGRRAVQRRP